MNGFGKGVVNVGMGQPMQQVAEMFAVGKRYRFGFSADAVDVVEGVLKARIAVMEPGLVGRSPIPVAVPVILFLDVDGKEYNLHFASVRWSTEVQEGVISHG